MHMHDALFCGFNCVNFTFILICMQCEQPQFSMHSCNWGSPHHHSHCQVLLSQNSDISLWLQYVQHTLRCVRIQRHVRVHHNRIFNATNEQQIFINHNFNCESDCLSLRLLAIQHNCTIVIYHGCIHCNAIRLACKFQYCFK